MRKIIIGIMGPGEQATEGNLYAAFELGQLIARQGWVLLTGGRNQGVMEAASRGVKAENGLTVGILPTATPSGVSSYVDIAILTGMGQSRNQINILSCDVVVGCGMGLGTASEIALALKSERPVILLAPKPVVWDFFASLVDQGLYSANHPSMVITLIEKILGQKTDAETTSLG